MSDHTDDNMDFSSILASTVHDMKNSLSSVINTLDDLTTEFEETLQSNKKIASLKYESKRLNNQLIVLLTLYKLENRQYSLSVEDHPVKEFLEDAVLPYQELLELNNIALTINCDNHAVWFFDENLLAGVIGNIINNAYRYTEDTIAIYAEIKENQLHISIEDNGPGFPQELLDKTSPTKKSISFQSGSTGLGLYFSQRIAEMHKNKNNRGYIQIDNLGINNGGRFSLVLP